MSWLIDVGGFAKKVKNTTLSSADQIKDCGAYRECPNCHYRIDNSDVSSEWPGFPLGVKFDPSDVELLEHLAGKCGVGNTQPDMFINEFISTLEGDQGICCTHPENLQGAKKDGSYFHFFHKTINAYATGQRKRRKIHHQQGLTEEHWHWHKTGRTKAIIQNGMCKGFKKIMVLHVRSKSGSKPFKSNWVMHQYHLGTEEEEKEGEYVVSKIFYQQQKQTENNEDNPMVEVPDNIVSRTSPRTPKPNPPHPPPRVGNSVDCDDCIYETIRLPSGQTILGESHAPISDVQDLDNSACLPGESQAEEHTEYDGLDDILLCKEILDSSALLNDSGLDSSNLYDLAFYDNQIARNDNESCGISVLDTLELDTPDFDHSIMKLMGILQLSGWADYEVFLVLNREVVSLNCTLCFFHLQLQWFFLFRMPQI
ncbi:SUPPRESSOR OF GAMMA RESPONSE 1-like isoform X2 [Vigna unguiculata]|uniref:SUPPRESSOR OF GAMMA RESPONSE 1-like isoform X2 n=1 Tax=Vigna unguiculata TaxID=3917 RepID=UPI0010165EC8|nr:SUPPRESSOR OF GAMMA RESPONSE 1-like isoform X2 [Vigna unguiculata]